MALTLREFRETDRPSLRALLVETRSAAFHWCAPETCRRDDFDALTEGETIIVAERNGRPVGFASIWEADSFLHNLFVHPDYFRQGVGSALLARCRDHFRTTATLKCVQANAPARAFYAAHGWTVVGIGIADGEPYVLMRLQPDPRGGEAG